MAIKEYLDSTGLSYLLGRLKTMFVPQQEGKQLSTNDYTNAEKQKLSGIAEGATKVIVDSALNEESNNPVTNKAVTTKLNQITSQGGEPNTIEAIKVNGQVQAPDGSKAVNITVPTKTSDLTNDSGYLTSVPIQYVTETELTGKGYQTSEQVESAITEKGYQNASQVESAITSKGYQTSEQVEEAITEKGYQTEPQVNTLITQKGYITTSAVDTKLNDYAKKSDVSSALKYKGTKPTYDELPSSGNQTGDVWNIEAADSAHNIKAGDNVAWNGTSWDVLAGTVDLSSYVQESDLVEITTGEIDDIISGLN